VSIVDSADLRTSCKPQSTLQEVLTQFGVQKAIMKIPFFFLMWYVVKAAAVPTEATRMLLSRGKLRKELHLGMMLMDYRCVHNHTLLYGAFSQYSAVAYCNATYTSVGAPLTCATGNCPLVEAS
jgi:hypothetical protein